MDSSEQKPKGRKYSYEALFLTMSPEIKETYLERYWSRVDKKGPKDCWEWNHTTFSNGYGMIGILKEITKAHRIAWVLHYNAPIPLGLSICHHCDNKLCCNVEHLYLATNRINTRDYNLKGLSSGFFRKSKVPLSVKKKHIIQSLEISSKFCQSRFARKHNVDPVLLFDSRRLFFSKHKDRSWLPQHLQIIYAKAKSWHEAKLIKAEYERKQLKAQGTVAPQKK